MEFGSKEFVEALTKADIHCRPYSGRGMDGKYCFAVTTDDVNETIKDMIILFMKENSIGRLGVYAHIASTEDFLNTLFDYYVDNMGRGNVLYWRGIPYPDTDEDDEY